MPDAAALIDKHRGKGVFVDTNLFVLLLVGLVNPRRIPEFKRTQDFYDGGLSNVEHTLWIGSGHPSSRRRTY